MSFGFFGIQFGWGLQMANMSAIYQYLGAKESELAVLWLAAPLTGLLVQPIIGYASDRTWGALGRRRPYFLTGAILASLALIAMPNSGAVWMAAGLLWILDASVNITMEPFRAFVGDLLPTRAAQERFRHAELAHWTGRGAFLGAALHADQWLWGQQRGDGQEPDSAGGEAGFLYRVGGVLRRRALYDPDDQGVSARGPGAFEKMKAESAGVGRAFREIFAGIGSMPRTMRQLAVVQFFTWFALFCMWLYFVPAVATGVFHGQTLGIHDAGAEEPG